MEQIINNNIKINNMKKIGLTVREEFRSAHSNGFITEDLVDKLKNKNWCKDHFNANIPVLIKSDDDPVVSGQRRYYATELFCGEHQLSSQWKESQRDAFNAFLGKLNTAIPERFNNLVNDFRRSGGHERSARRLEKERENGMRDDFDILYTEFMTAFRDAAGVRFRDADGMHAHFTQIPKYYFTAINRARNEKMHPENRVITDSELKEFVVIGKSYMKLALDKLRNV